jgi:cellulose synthase/poly-beta-1,6-N-acetylglucosamine synthase-like glycosyltransferase
MKHRMRMLTTMMKVPWNGKPKHIPLDLMKEKPLISVILTVYNTEFVLVKRAIESILKQDHENFELLVVNDSFNPIPTTTSFR